MRNVDVDDDSAWKKRIKLWRETRLDSESLGGKSFLLSKVKKVAKNM